MAKREAGTALHEEFGIGEDEDVTMPGPRSYRAGASLLHWYGNPQSGCRTLQDFKKISILEVKGYCYGWHFYQAADADLVISSDDALFGHPAFRYVGYVPRMWQWAMMMGLRKFQEMVFTGRPFTAEQMYECNFVNSVVPRADLEAETAKYASACSAHAAHRHRVHAEGLLRGDEAAPGRVHGQPAQRLARVHGRPAPGGRQRRPRHPRARRPWTPASMSPSRTMTTSSLPNGGSAVPDAVARGRLTVPGTGQPTRPTGPRLPLGIPCRRPVDLDRRRLLHEAAGRRGRGGHQGGGARR